MHATPDQMEAVVKAAEYLLGARQDQLLTIEEWIELARAVGAVRGRATADLLAPHDLEDVRQFSIEWNEQVDGPLPAPEF